MFEPEDHLLVRFQTVKERGVLWKELLKLLVAALDQVDHAEARSFLTLLVVALEKALLVYALAHDEETESMDHKVEEMAEVVLESPVLALKAEDRAVDA